MRKVKLPPFSERSCDPAILLETAFVHVYVRIYIYICVYKYCTCTSKSIAIRQIRYKTVKNYGWTISRSVNLRVNLIKEVGKAKLSGAKEWSTSLLQFARNLN